MNFSSANVCGTPAAWQAQRLQKPGCSIVEKAHTSDSASPVWLGSVSVVKVQRVWLGKVPEGGAL